MSENNDKMKKKEICQGNFLYSWWFATSQGGLKFGRGGAIFLDFLLLERPRGGVLFGWVYVCLCVGLIKIQDSSVLCSVVKFFMPPGGVPLGQGIVRHRGGPGGVGSRADTTSGTDRQQNE